MMKPGDAIIISGALYLVVAIDDNGENETISLQHPDGTINSYTRDDLQSLLWGTRPDKGKMKKIYDEMRKHVPKPKQNPYCYPTIDDGRWDDFYRKRRDERDQEMWEERIRKYAERVKT